MNSKSISSMIGHGNVCELPLDFIEDIKNLPESTEKIIISEIQADPYSLFCVMTRAQAEAFVEVHPEFGYIDLDLCFDGERDPFEDSSKDSSEKPSENPSEDPSGSPTPSCL